jgi:arsenate reductase-like glutaredoxin family protein
LMVANPTLIKRPVVIYKNDVMVGFKEQDYVTYFGK